MNLKLMGIRIRYEIVELLRPRIEDIVHEIFHQRGDPVIEEFFILRHKFTNEVGRLDAQSLDLHTFKKGILERIRCIEVMTERIHYIEGLLEASRGNKLVKRSLNSKGK